MIEFRERLMDSPTSSRRKNENDGSPRSKFGKTNIPLLALNFNNKQMG
jgi:hypothetical protein